MKRKEFLLMALLMLVIFSLGIFLSVHFDSRSKQETSGVVLQQARPLEPFHLLDGKSQAFTQKNLQGHWTLLFFGFTHCPMLCPTTMAILNQMYHQLEKNKQQPMPQVVFISIDPERDTPARVDSYAKGFNPAFIGVTGGKSQLESLTKQLSIMYIKVKSANGGKADPDYTIDHSGTILLMNPQGDLYAIFSMPHEAKKLAEDFKYLTH